MTTEAVSKEAPSTPAEPTPQQRAEAFVAKRAKEWKVPGAEAPVAPATPEPVKAAAPDAAPKDGAKATKADQAEEVKPQGDEQAKDPAKGKPEPSKSSEYEWASERLARRLPDLLAGKEKFSAEDVAEIKSGYLLRKGADEKFREAAKMREHTATERDKAARYDEIMSDSDQRMALVRVKASRSKGSGESRPPTLDETLANEAGAVEIPDPVAEPEKFRAWKAKDDERVIQRAFEQREREQQDRERRKAARAKEVQGWAVSHHKGLNGTVSEERYMEAAESYLKFMQAEHPESLRSMTETAFQAGVSRELAHLAERDELTSLREGSERSKQAAVRDASASSPPGLRVHDAYVPDSTTKNGRIEKTMRELRLGRYAT